LNYFPIALPMQILTWDCLSIGFSDVFQVLVSVCKHWKCTWMD